jgi:hypothetical protein
MRIDVETYVGHHQKPMPRSLRLHGREVEVEAIDQWHGPDYRYVKVRGGEGGLYILRHDTVRDVWELTMFKSAQTEEHAFPPRRRGVTTQ